MTLDETRQLGIEFERRVQTMIPEAEYALKLDTETIYSYLNQYQDKFIHDIYKAMDNIPTPSKPSAYVESIIRGLLTELDVENIAGTNGMFSINLPEQFGLYVESSTTVDSSYKKHSSSSGEGVVPNVLISKTQGSALLQRPQDNMRIMRQPVAYIDTDKTIKVLYDRYTEPIKFHMSYYKVPQYMNLFKGEEGKCELPMTIFDDLVTGAVDLYVQYAIGVDARRRQLNERNRNNRREDNDERS